MRIMPRGFFDHLDQEPPEVLYHYTSLDSLMKIVSTRSLLASDTRFLNDTKELIHLKSTIGARVKMRLRDATDHSKAALIWLLRQLESTEHDPVYVVSFSKNSDDLSQWRGYTPAGQGVCIGFSTRALTEALNLLRGDRHEHERFLMLGKVIYIGRNEGLSFDNFITSACEHIDVIDGEVVRTVAAERLIVSAMPFYKHIAFENECEWRVRISANSVFIDDPLKVVSRLGKSSLIPATSLSFKESCMENSFIREILVGPTPEPQLSLYSLKQFLDSQTMENIRLSASTVPYRTW